MPSDQNRLPPFPPFTLETAIQKVRMAEDAWNTRDPERVSLAYSADSQWRNRSEFLTGREAIVQEADVAKRAQRGLRLANDLPKKEPDARPGTAAVAGTFCRGHHGTSHGPVGRGAGTECRRIVPAAPSGNCHYTRELSSVR